MAEDITARTLLDTPSVAVHDVCCQGRVAEAVADEWVDDTHLVYAYRGVFVRHVDREDVVAEANQVLFFNPGEVYRVSHPVPGGDDCLDLVVNEAILRELMPRHLLRRGRRLAIRPLRLGIDPRAQALVALLRHSLRHGTAETLEAESLALTLVRRSLGSLATGAPGASEVRRRLVDRTKLVLASDLARRWTLADLAAAVGHSGVYLTQVFQQVEGVPLYRYHLRLRLARALDLLAEYDDLTALGLDLGFSSHSHFTTAFSRAFGRSPSAFRGAGKGRRRANGAVDGR